MSIVNSYLTHLNNKDLIDGAMAKAMLEGLKNAEDKINLANDAIANVDSLPIEDDTANRANSRKVRALRSVDNSDLR
jgi:hypothetical protein